LVLRIEELDELIENPKLSANDKEPILYMNAQVFYELGGGI